MTTKATKRALLAVRDTLRGENRPGHWKWRARMRRAARRELNLRLA